MLPLVKMIKEVRENIKNNMEKTTKKDKNVWFTLLFFKDIWKEMKIKVGIIVEQKQQY